MYVQYSFVENRHLPEVKQEPFFSRERLVVSAGIGAMVATVLLYLLV